MKTFVLMTKIARADANLIEVASKLRDREGEARSWLTEIKRKCPEVKFLAHYALLGTWDFMDIYEAPDEETAVKVSLITRSQGAHVVESWPAIPNDRIMELTRELRD
ncbi:MAG: GYD domain-containing protein [Candidatus Zixiibacteriota bacterium]